jgi:hypothetical protein
MATGTFKITIHMVSSLDGYIAKKTIALRGLKQLTTTRMELT